MIYTTEIVVHIAIDDFLKKLENADNMKHWQKHLTSFEHISGDPGTVGSKMQLNYTVDKRKVELIETITHTNLPHEIYKSYETEGMYNYQKNHFYTTPEGYTKWIVENEFSPSNIVYKIMVLLMPKAFKKQSKKYLLDFKNFAENGTSIQHA